MGTIFEAKKKPPLGDLIFSGAGNEVRTRDPNHGKVMLYQLSYSRITESENNYRVNFKYCKEFYKKIFNFYIKILILKEIN